MKKKKNIQKVNLETISENKESPNKPDWVIRAEENPGIRVKTELLSRTEFIAGIDPANEENHTVAVFKVRQLGREFDSHVEFFKQYMNFPQTQGIRFPHLIDEMRKIDDMNMEEFRKKYKSPKVGEIIPSTLDEQQPWPEPLREFWNPHYRVDINCLEQSEQSKENMMKAFNESGYLIVKPDEKDIRWAIDQLKKGEIVRNSAWPKEMLGIALEISSENSGNIVLIEDQNFLKPKYKFTNEDVLFGTWEIVR